MQSQLEALPEEMMIKLSSVVSDLFGLSVRRILSAITAGGFRQTGQPGRTTGCVERLLRGSKLEGKQFRFVQVEAQANRLLADPRHFGVAFPPHHVPQVIA